MMTKTRSNSKGSYLRASFFLAFMSVILFLGASSDRGEERQNDKVASYEQGEEAMYNTVRLRMTYPAISRKENRSGSVRVSFTVNENGNVEDIEAVTGEEGHVLKEIVVVGYSQSPTPVEEQNGIDDALKAAAIHAVEGLGRFIPAQKDGKPVSSVLILPIKFKLN